MSEINFDHMERDGLRAKALAQQPNQDPILAAAAPKLVDSVDRYVAVHHRLIATETSMKTEQRRSSSVFKALGQIYDRVRAAIMIGTSEDPMGMAASHFATPDDLLKGSMLIKETLDKYADMDWAQKLIDVFAPALEQAQSIWLNWTAAQAALQKLQAERRQNADSLNALMVGFRKLVKSVYGKTSKEYHSIKGNGHHGDADADSVGVSPVLVEPQKAIPISS
jgi:hypothetical protein